MNTLSIKDFTLDEAIKIEADLKAYIKEQKATIKSTAKAEKAEAMATADHAGRNFASTKAIGDTISIIFKGNIEAATIREIAEKTIKVTLLHLTREDGKVYNTAVKYDKVIVE
jgi:hypothetical protein